MNLPVPAVGPADAAGAAPWLAGLINHRQTILPKRLLDPAPTQDELDLIFRAAAAAPDHGERVPWRFILVPQASRGKLAEEFAAALMQRDSAATPDQAAQAREKAFRSPVLMLVVVNTGSPQDEIPAVERFISAGCAIQNMLLMATALGYGSALTSGKAMDYLGLRQLFTLAPQEQAVCFLSLGTAARRKPARARPQAPRFVSELGGG